MADYLAAIGITLAVVLVATIVWFTGSASSADHRGEALGTEQPAYSPSTSLPTGLNFEWETPNDTIGAPLVSTGNVFTTDGSGITAWQAGIKNEQWSYHRPASLCAATVFAKEVLTVFQGGAGCSDATAFETATGNYFSTRQSAFADQMQLWTTHSHVLALSPDRLEIWRDDLVRTVEYGHVAAPQEAGMQPRSGCSFQSAQLNSENFAVAEVCPGVDRVRLTVSKVVPEDSRKPEEKSSVITGFDELHLIGLTESGVAVGVARIGQHWSLQTIASSGDAKKLLDLPGEPEQLPRPENVTVDPALFRWFDGSTMYAFDARDGRATWLANDVTGPGLGLGYSVAEESASTPSQVLLPGAEGILVAAASDGEILARFGTDAARSESGAPVGLSQIGNILYIQADGTLRAFKLIDSQ